MQDELVKALGYGCLLWLALMAGLWAWTHWRAGSEIRRIRRYATSLRRAGRKLGMTDREIVKACRKLDERGVRTKRVQ